MVKYIIWFHQVNTLTDIQKDKLFVNYIEANNGDSEVFSASYDFYIDGTDDKCYIQDLRRICNPVIAKEWGCCGAPDWII